MNYKLIVQTYGPAESKSIAVGILSNDSATIQDIHCSLYNYCATSTTDLMKINGRLSYVLSTERQLEKAILSMAGLNDCDSAEEMLEAITWADAFTRKHVIRRKFLTPRAGAGQDSYSLGNPSAENLSDHDAK